MAAGRHRAGAGRPAWRLIAALRNWPVDIADVRGGIAHVGEEFVEHQHAGRYLAFCGARLLAAGVGVPDRGRGWAGVGVIEVLGR